MVFFSGTDMDELYDNVGNHLFYVSLVVNNKLEMIAKVVTLATIKTEVKTNFTFKHFSNILNTEKTEEVECMLDIDLDIDVDIPDTIDDIFKDRLEYILKKCNKVTYSNLNCMGRGYSYDYPGYSEIGSSLGFKVPEKKETVSDKTFSDFFINKFLVRLINADPKMDVFPAHNVRPQITSMARLLSENSIKKGISYTHAISTYISLLDSKLEKVIEKSFTESDMFKDGYKKNKAGLIYVLLQEAVTMVQYYTTFDTNEEQVQSAIVSVLESASKSTIMEPESKTDQLWKLKRGKNK